MEKVLGYYSDVEVEKAKMCDIFIICQNEHGDVYAYLPLQNVYMSLDKDEKEEYKKYTFLKGVIKLSHKDFETIMKK